MFPEAKYFVLPPTEKCRAIIFIVQHGNLKSENNVNLFIEIFNTVKLKLLYFTFHPTCDYIRTNDIFLPFSFCFCFCNFPLYSARRVPVSELSINRLENLSTSPGGTTIRAVLNSLDFPTYKVRALLGCLSSLSDRRFTMVSVAKLDYICNSGVLLFPGLQNFFT